MVNVWPKDISDNLSNPPKKGIGTMAEHFVFSGSFDISDIPTDRRDEFLAEAGKVITQSLEFVRKWGLDNEPFNAQAYNAKVTIV